MLSNYTFSILIILVSVNCVIGANILFISPILSPSHHLWNRALALGLVNKGHNVTLIGPDKETIDKANYTTILLEGVYEELYKNTDANEFANYNPLQMLLAVNDFLRIICKLQLETKGLQQLLDYPQDFKFDLILYDVTMDWCLGPIITRFNSPPLIGVTAYLLPPYVSINVGNHLSTSYIPNFNLPYTNEMTFIERLTNFVYTRFEILVRHRLIYPQIEVLTKKKFGDNTPSWQQFYKHMCLLLANTDPVLDYPQPLAPNIIPVGGLHTNKPKQIPLEFQKILDNAKNGVIVFSLGTNVRSDKLSDDQKRSLLEAFSRLKETIIWKFESNLDNLPKNVIIRKWLPQNDILSHPNIRLFIGHGGALSTQEAIYHNVPMVLIPFFLDQILNAERVQQKQLGVIVRSNQITSNYFHGRIREVLDNPMYKENMRKASQRFHDQLQTPLEKAVFWIEYILKHGGDDVLSTKAKYMPYYQAAEIDVMVFLTVVLLLILLIVVKTCKVLIGLFVPKQKVKIN